MHHTKPVKKGDSHRMKWLYPGCQLGLLLVAANQSLITARESDSFLFQRKAISVRFKQLQSEHRNIDVL